MCLINDRRQDRRIGEWISSCVDVRYQPSNVCFGVEENGELIGAAMLNEYNGSNICIHQRISRPRGMTRGLLKSAFSFAFDHLRVARVTGVVKISNQKAIDINLRMGFEVEGVLKRYLPDGDGYVHMVMWKENCKFIGG